MMQRVSHLFAGGFVVSRRRGGLPGLAQQVGEHRAGAGAAALGAAARPTLTRQRDMLKSLLIRIKSGVSQKNIGCTV